MRRLDSSYGKRTYEVWCRARPTNLRRTLASPSEAKDDAWSVSSFPDLVDRVAFLTSMNKRLTLLYRGQSSDWPLHACLFRDEWLPYGGSKPQPVGARWVDYWDQLGPVGDEVYKVMKEAPAGIPRARGFRDTREIQWAVIQHYGLWPTPFFDLTSSLRVAATFAMDFVRGTSAENRLGYVYVFGMPYLTGSIAFDFDQHLTLARLQSCCPPLARRPHYQDGFLVSHFPIERSQDLGKRRGDLDGRLVAKFELSDDGSFWKREFPILSNDALMPASDELHEHFIARFGATAGTDSLGSRAERIGTPAVRTRFT